MSQTIVQVDAFADRPFAGNPAAVCIMSGPAEESWMQNVAREMNLAETAFLYPKAGAYSLRWFTPTVEMELCGHATLASAHVLWEEGHLTRDTPARFITRSGELTAERDGAWIQMDFPAIAVTKTVAPEGISEALGVSPVFTSQSEFNYLVELGSDQLVRTLKPDIRLLAALPARGVIVTAPSSDSRFDFVSRFFAPAIGIDEDPVTGSAHCALGPYWQERLNKNRFVAYQASARGGVVRVAVNGGRVSLGGQAVTVMRGQLAP